jgi:N-acetylglutamate synthase-like GNAT family acetyltransferase
MKVQLIKHNSNEYQTMIALRLQVLLDPIGVPVSFINQPKEKDDFLIAAFEADEMIGCCVLTPIDSDMVQLRQMAVLNDYQGKGIGKEIIDFGEHLALEKGFKKLRMHARDEAVHFYKKSGYVIVGNPFTEVGILHHKMEKELVQ